MVIARDSNEAHSAIDMMLIDKKMGAAGNKIIIEEFLQGEELSFIVATDGEHIVPQLQAEIIKTFRKRPRAKYWRYGCLLSCY